jgi:hypothetical protein
MRDDFHPASPAPGPVNDSRAIRLFVRRYQRQGRAICLPEMDHSKGEFGAAEMGILCSRRRAGCQKGKPGRKGSFAAREVECGPDSLRQQGFQSREGKGLRGTPRALVLVVLESKNNSLSGNIQTKTGQSYAWQNWPCRNPGRLE